MPVDRPTARELIESAAEHLALNVRPVVRGHGGFEALVAANLLAIALRELDLDAELQADDRRALGEVLGRDGPLAELEQELAGLIRQGELDDRSADLHAILKRSTRRRLQIANPGYAPDVA